MKSRDVTSTAAKLKEQTDDLNPGAEVRKLVDQLGSEVSRLEEELAELYDSQFVETAKDRPLLALLIACAAGVLIGLYLGRRSRPSV